MWAAAQRAGNNLVVAPDKPTLAELSLTQSIIKTNEQRPPVPIMVRRLRNTWLAHHLVAGTPLQALLPAAGLSGLAHLQDLLPYLPEPGAPAAALRRAGI